MSDVIAKHRVASVVLNYNSLHDLAICVPQLVAQVGICHDLLVVDNASDPATVVAMVAWFRQQYPSAIVGTVEEVGLELMERKSRGSTGPAICLALNERNLGYSAGNNCGARLAGILCVDAVLLINPDVRIENPRYLESLADAMFCSPSCLIAASRILGLSGLDESPLREPSFWEELLWPRVLIARFLRPISHVVVPTGVVPYPVAKVSGCCMLLRMTFLKSIGYLDEGVFLYSEEPILSARVRSLRGQILLVPALAVLHAHDRALKGNSSARVLVAIRSRLYYLSNYSGYGLGKRLALRVSYFLLSVAHRLKLRLAVARQ